MSEETFDYICNYCAKENITKEAIKYCVECKEYYCDVCVQMHAKFPGLAEHSLLDVSTIQQTDQSPRLPSFPTERCSIHQGKVVDMYCGDHDTVGCYACIAINHKTCTDIHSVPDDIDQISTDEDYDTTYNNLQTFIQSLQTTMKKSTDDYAKKIDDMKETALLAVTENRREVDAILDRLEESSRSEIEALYQELKSQLLAANEKLESILNECIQLELKLKQAKGNISQTFVSAKIIESTINREQDNTKGVDNDLQVFAGDCILSYTADYRLFDHLKSINLGKVQGHSKEDPYVITRRQSIDIKVPTDTKICCSYGSCILGDNDVLITDHSNKKLKRVNMAQMAVVDNIRIPYNVVGICKINNKEVAVACLDEKMIQFVSIGQTMTLSRQLKLNHKCAYVACTDDKLFITDDAGGSLYIYNMVGTLLQTLSTDSKENKLFRNSLQVILCAGGIFVTAFGDGLVCLDRKGNHIKSIKDSSIEGTYGIVQDGRRNILVTGRNSNNIVQLNYDGQIRGVVVKEGDGIKQPTSLCFKPDSCKLFVNMENSDKMMVFDLI